jgi:hypothetical protein
MPEQEIMIDAPAEKVFSYLSDLTLHSEWSNGRHKLQVEKISDGPIGEGTRFKSVGFQFGRNEDTVTITEYVDGRRIVFEAEGKVGLVLLLEHLRLQLLESFPAVRVLRFFHGAPRIPLLKGAQVEADEHPLRVRQIADDLADRQGKLPDQRRDGNDLVQCLDRRLLNLLRGEAGEASGTRA